jgi:sarcosine oxidase subunit gamma
MSDPVHIELAARSPLEALNEASISGLTPAAPVIRHVLRGRDAALTAASGALGFTLPQTPCRAASLGDRHALWLGPDEWLVLSPPGDGLEGALAAAIGSHPHSLVEVTHRQVGLILSGSHVETILAGGCPLDVALRAFPVGMCTRTLFEKAEIVLWRTEAHRFHIEVWRSFASYLLAHLHEAMDGLS